MKKALLILLFIASLPSCVAAFVAGAASGGLAVYDRRTIQTMWQDNDISYKIERKINIDDELYHRAHINVTCFDHVVLLTGQAPTPDLKARAQSIARSVPGSRKIYNEIELSGPTSSIARSNDSWVTTKVKTKMLAAKGLKSTQIKIVTENGTVYLMGTLSHQQADIAVNVARRVGGVQHVVTIFQYNA